MNNSLEQKVREICTYYSDLGEGTAGYNLSEEQFEKLFALIKEQQLAVLEKVQEEAWITKRVMAHIPTGSWKRVDTPYVTMDDLNYLLSVLRTRIQETGIIKE